MFGELERRLEELGRGVRVSIQIPLDEKGYIDRKCPAEECKTEFKVQSDDWQAKVRDEVVFCPICRHQAAGTEWNAEATAGFPEQAVHKNTPGGP